MKKKNYEYEVALSFAGEQREYVEKVSQNLTKLGVKHFYDNNEQVNLWGKNLSQYLDAVYFEKSLYFVPFISKEYIKKIWTRLEINSALDRNMKENRPDFQQYILPVRFDDTRVPGIVNSIAHIDARKNTPEAIALMISHKLHGSKKKITFEDNDLDNEVTYEYNTKINADKLSILEKLYNHLNKSHTVVLYGERGLGKKSCVQYFLQNKKNIIKIGSEYECSYQLQSVIHALGLDMSQLPTKTDLTFTDQIKKEFFSLCKSNSSIIYIEHFNTFDQQTQIFLLEITNVLLSRFLSYKTFIIFEFDIDEDVSQLVPFYSLPPGHTDFLLFDKLSLDELKLYFYSVLGEIDISEGNLNYIFESSFGNIRYLNIAINFLKGEKYIQVKNGRYICKKLPSGILSNVLKDFILQRYNRLDSTLKDILSKSSIIGNVFNAELLSKPFQIINADDMLQKIEKISQLIVQPDDTTYSFENEDVYNLIRNSISPQLQKEWHGILADYYKKLLKKEQRRKGRKSIQREIAILSPIAKHYMYAQQYEASVIYFLELIAKYETISDYLHELDAINNVNEILSYVDLDDLHLDSLEYNMLKSEADCYRNLGDFPRAVSIYEECLSYFYSSVMDDSQIEVLYQQAYSLYMNGEIQRSFKILSEIKKNYESNRTNNFFYIKVLSLLASVCDTTGDAVSQKKYYIEALNFYKSNQYDQEYYILLRMASMVYGEELGISMEETAAAFFRQQHSVKYLAESLHNIATDYLYMGELKKAEKFIGEAVDLFDSYGSIAIHYSLNTKAILEMVINMDYNKAVETFEEALKYKIEPYSEITIRTNMLNCFNMLGNSTEAMKQLEYIDKLIELQSSEYVPVYAIYQNLNWAFYYFHLKKYDECLQKLKTCSKLEYMELRFKYIYKTLQYESKKALGLKTRNTAGTAPKKIYNFCLKNGFYFTTLRFYESI